MAGAIRSQDSPEESAKDKVDWVGPLPGTVTTQFIRCGKMGCHCVNAQLHGPYFYRIFRDGGKVRKVYVKASEVERVKLQCEQHRIFTNELRVAEAKRIVLTACIRQEIRRFERLKKAFLATQK